MMGWARIVVAEDKMVRSCIYCEESGDRFADRVNAGCEKKGVRSDSKI